MGVGIRAMPMLGCCGWTLFLAAAAAVHRQHHAMPCVSSVFFSCCDCRRSAIQADAALACASELALQLGGDSGSNTISSDGFRNTRWQLHRTPIDHARLLDIQHGPIPCSEIFIFFADAAAAAAAAAAFFSGFRVFHRGFLHRLCQFQLVVSLWSVMHK